MVKEKDEKNLQTSQQGRKTYSIYDMKILLNTDILYQQTLLITGGRHTTNGSGISAQNTPFATLQMIQCPQKPHPR